MNGRVQAVRLSSGEAEDLDSKAIIEQCDRSELLRRALSAFAPGRETKRQTFPVERETAKELKVEYDP